MVLTTPIRRRAPATTIEGVMAKVMAQPVGFKRIPNLRILPIPGGKGLDSGHHPSIGVTNALPPIGIAGAFCGLDSVQINEKFDAVLELLSNRKFVYF
ncbi:hypothetical protein CRG98_026926 [Punica granatum]|uniref:Uncharacterized protein n=1 Tax=Punica granatum TaxID=22663 RepID=A0A2I0J9Y6_PUNGR|nr:hypothetical protein CRG98_026926 [Punica granatum]